MSETSFDKLLAHAGHKISCVTYVGKEGEPVNVSIECEDCKTVLMGFDKSEEESAVGYEVTINLRGTFSIGQFGLDKEDAKRDTLAEWGSALARLRSIPFLNIEQTDDAIEVEPM